MGKIIVITFAFMAFAFYELSGGSDFVAIADEKRAALAIEQEQEQRLLAKAKAERLRGQAQAEPEPQVFLASTVATTAVEIAPQAEAVATAELAVEAEKVDAVVAEPTIEVATSEVASEPQSAPAPDLRKVTAARVNMRQGPGQNFSVIAKLTNGDEVEILQDPGDGWVKLRVKDSGNIGWMADFLLTASNN